MAAQGGWRLRQTTHLLRPKQTRTPSPSRSVWLQTTLSPRPREDDRVRQEDDADDDEEDDEKEEL